MDKEGKYSGDAYDSSSYSSLIDNDQCKRLCVTEKVYKTPMLEPHPDWVPTGSLLPCLCALTFYAEKINIYGRYFFSFIALSFIVILLINQPDFGQTLLTFLTWLSLIFVSGINLFIFFIFFILLLFFLVSAVFIFPNKFGYIIVRLKSFFDPTSGNNYQSEKASEAIISGGFFGKGIGEGTLKSRVPEAHTDYIVSVISEEFGVLFITILMIIFLFFVYMVFKKLYS